MTVPPKTAANPKTIPPMTSIEPITLASKARSTSQNRIAIAAIRYII